MMSYFRKTLLYYLLETVLLTKVPHWRMPPGPLANWIPFFGSLPLFVGTPKHLMLAKIAKKYSRLYRLSFGSNNYIVICDHKLLESLYLKDEMCGKKMPVMMDVMEGKGIIQADGDFWTSQSCFVYQVMVGIGLSRFESNNVFDKKASTAIGAFLEEMKATNGNPIFIDEALSFTLTNIFFSVIVGKTFERDDWQLKSIIDSCHQSFRATEPISFANFIPFIFRLPSNKKILKDIETRKVIFSNYMRDIIHDHSKNPDPKKPEDLIDVYLAQIVKRRPYFTEPQLIAILGDLFTSSLEKPAATIHWLLLVLVKYRGIQQRIQEELDKVLKNERAPTVDDRSSLPYLEAIILEGYRFFPILPYGAAHNATEDTVIDSYHIPKNATITGLPWKFNRDESLWNFPNEFNPNNHFTRDGILFKTRTLMPYSTGKRTCISAKVANDEIFLVLASLLQKFTILPSETPLPRLDESMDGILRAPLPFKIRVVPRSSPEAALKDPYVFFEDII